MARIKNRIRRLRFDHDEMTQEELANRAGCTRQTIIALEQNKYVPSIELAFRIAKAFGVSLEEVFQDEDSQGG
jgi:putative transcriptional regulator